MTKATQIRFEIGTDVYGRPTEAIWKRLYNGKCGFEIIRHEGSQRDESESVELLTIEQLVQLGEIAKKRELF